MQLTSNRDAAQPGAARRLIFLLILRSVGVSPVDFYRARVKYACLRHVHAFSVFGRPSLAQVLRGHAYEDR